MQWEERIVKPYGGTIDNIGVPYFDMVLKTVAYSMVYNAFDYTCVNSKDEYSYLWCKITKADPYEPTGDQWDPRQFHDLPKYVRDRFDEVRPLFKLMR